ncbi:MAG: tripartite tricarboxylate transporter TctB family protein [Gemmobacter sp.]|nr:tripartite tricarboxylate transporter TctB family protein [Gemmobacter sp.]
MESNAQSGAHRTWRNGRIAAGALGLGFAVVYLVEGNNLTLGRMRSPGPGVFPLVVGVLFALVSIGVIFDALTTREPGVSSYPKGADLRRLLLVSGAFVVYVALLMVIGFPVATLAFVICFARLVGNVSWFRAVLGGVGLSATVWVIFTLILGVRLPAGIWS